MNKTPRTLKTEFLEIYNKISHLSGDDILFGNIEKYLPYIESLRKLGQRKVSHSLKERSKKIPKITKSLRKVSEIMYFSNLRREIEDSKRITKDTNSFEAIKKLSYYNEYKSTISTEVKGAGLRKGDKLLFLGSGPLPISLILFSYFFNIDSIGIERERKFCDYSKNLIKKLGMEDRIKIIHGDHFSLPFNEKFEHLIIALDAEPKDEIFNHLQNNLLSGTQFSFRINPATNVLIDDAKVKYLTSLSFTTKLFSEAEPPGVNSVIFMKKK